MVYQRVAPTVACAEIMAPAAAKHNLSLVPLASPTSGAERIQQAIREAPGVLENHGKTMGKPWENPWENWKTHRQMVVEWDLKGIDRY